MYVFIHRGKPRKSSPKVFVFTEKGHHYISNNLDTTVFEDDWSSCQTKVKYILPNILKATFAKKIEVKFESNARMLIKLELTFWKKSSILFSEMITHLEF